MSKETSDILRVLLWSFVFGVLGVLAADWIRHGFSVHGRAGFAITISGCLLFSLVGLGLAEEINKRGKSELPKEPDSEDHD